MKGTYINKRSATEWVVDYVSEGGDVVMYTNAGRCQSRIISRQILEKNYTKKTNKGDTL